MEHLDVTLIGIDGSGKSTIISDLVDSFSKDYVVAHSGRPAYVSGPNIERKNIYKRSIKLINKGHNFADSLNSRIGVAMANALDVLEWKRRHEGIIEEYNPKIIFAGRHRAIDSVVYSSYYLPFTNFISDKNKFGIIESLTGKVNSDLLFYLQLSPETAMARIDKRTEKEKLTSDKPKGKHMHENLRDLTKLRNKFEKILDYYCSTRGEVIVVDVEKNGQKESVSIIENKIRENLHKVL
ncbi:Thymidylate kinase [uncultured archaeon]|nr:Thymidylate kinase [uncultured archaeon]